MSQEIYKVNKNSKMHLTKTTLLIIPFKFAHSKKHTYIVMFCDVERRLIIRGYYGVRLIFDLLSKISVCQLFCLNVFFVFFLVISCHNANQYESQIKTRGNAFYF